MSTLTYVGMADAIEMVETGRWDTGLAELKRVIAKREGELKGSWWRENIQVGWRVRISDSASPRYWRNHTGTVVRVGSGVNCIKIELDSSVYRRNGVRIPAGSRIDCRRSLLEPVDE